MNAKQVLNKIMTLLSKEEEKMATAKLADGTIVESPSFAIGDAVEVVTEDGKVAAPDGEHEVVIADAEGNEVFVKVTTEGGVITEREETAVVEAEEEGKEEAIEDMVAGLIDALTPDEVSTEVAEEIAEKVLDALEDKIEVLKKRTKMAEETEEIKPLDAEKEDMMTKLSYRIDELEKKVKMMEEKKAKMEEEEEEDEEEMELPKLNGAPVEQKLSKVEENKGKVKNSQSTFLSKLYK